MKSKYPGIEVIAGKKGRSYKVRYRDGIGRQTSRTFRLLTDARAFKSEIDVARSHGALPSKRATAVTFAELAKEWVESRHHRPKTALRRDGILAKHLLPPLGAMTLDNIRHATLQNLVKQWSAAGLKPHTIKQHAQILSSILDLAVKNDTLVKNPAKGLSLPKAQRKEVRALSPEECLALIEAAGDDYAPIIEIFLATGCRWAEIEAMNVEHFSARDHTIKVVNSKTDAGNRTITLDPGEAAIITKHLLATGRSGAIDGPLFTSPDGHRLNYANFRSRVFIPAVKRAGLTDVTIHTLRRTHATMLITGGHNLKAVQNRMGHASSQTTLTHYAAARTEDVVLTAGAMSAYLKRSEADPTAERTA